MPQRPDDPAADASGSASDAEWEDLVARLRGMDDEGAAATEPPETAAGPGTGPQARTVRPARTPGSGAGTPAPPPAGTPGAPPDQRRNPSGDPLPGPLPGPVPGPLPGPPPGADGRSWDATEQMDAAERRVDAAEGFVPPDPGPVLGGEPLRTAAWLAVVGAPLVVVLALVAWPGAPAGLLQAAGLVFLLGVAVLVWRMPHRRDPDDPDDGAVV